MQIRRVLRCFAVDMYDPEIIARLAADKSELDGRALYNFSLKELKKRVSPEIWGKISSQDPLLQIPELEDVCDIEDALPHFHHTLPPHLSRPAILLNERQREAKRMTLQYMKAEPELLELREKEMNAFPVTSTDDYEVYTGMMIVRDPIWLLAEDIDIEWMKLRYKMMLEHGFVANLKPKDFDYEKEVSEFESERSIRLKNLERKMDNKEDLEYIPIQNSVHHLEADPYEKDSHSIAYAGGHRVWLLLKERDSGKWVFPTMKMFGTDSFIDCRWGLMKDTFGSSFKAFTLGPGAVKADVVDYPEPVIVKRPRVIEEDIYDLYMKRLKILFPKADKDELVKYLIKRYDMHPITKPEDLKINGKKVFYFRAIYESGNFTLKENGQYNDWAWVPKLEMNKYLDEDSFSRLTKAMTRN